MLQNRGQKNHETSMNRINKLFQERKKGILNVYFTAGYPTLNDTLSIAKSLEVAGADMIEIGIPFSDPVADGETIQKSNNSALKNGMSLKLLFDQLEDLRTNVQIPVILMGYVNPVLQYGVKNFCKRCQEVGVDGVILPDLPMELYQKEYRKYFDDNGLKMIYLITPQTSEDRIHLIDQATDGFIYMVSSASTTGGKKDISSKQKNYFNRIRSMNLLNPTLIGFGISDAESFSQACEYANGAIIGSAFINAISNTENLDAVIKSFIQSIKN